MATYSELLRDPRWQKMRLKKLEAAEWKCQCCDDVGTTLHVHHKRYVKGRSPWEYDAEELVVLCEHCHEEAHPLAESRSALLARLDDGAGGPCEFDAFMAAGSAWISRYAWRDEKLCALIGDVAERSPGAYAACRFAERLHFVSRRGFERLVELAEGDADFVEELIALFRKHGVALLGDQPS